MEWRRDDGYVVSDEVARIDRRFVSTWIGEESYWAAGRPHDVMSRAIDASLCFGLFAPDGTQVGFARFVTDRATFAYMADVFVVEAHRGCGAGAFLVDVAVAHPDVAGCRQTLRTTSAAGLYEQFGYRPLTEDERDAWMMRPPPG